MENKYIVITRSASDNKSLKKRLEELGYHVFEHPCIETKANYVGKIPEKAIRKLPEYDWIIFTSKRGIVYFMQALEQFGIDIAILQGKKIGVVGSKTAEEAKKFGLPIHLMSSEFTTKSLADVMPDIQSQKILLPRANIASPVLIKDLEAKGAIVTNVPIYQTKYSTKEDKKFNQILENDQISCITFTSPSTVTGCMKSLTDEELKEKLIFIPVISIGPVTTKAAINYFFKRIYTANPHTIEGIVKKIQENII